MGEELGLSNERTALAWQRTAISLSAGCAVMARLTFDRVGPIALTPIVVAAALGTWVLVESRWRYDQHGGNRERRRGRGGRGPLFLSLAVILMGLAEILTLIASA